jgi:cytochrome c oxidase subunit 3
VGIIVVSPIDLPLLNTIILLASGVTVTYSHHGLIGGSQKGLRGLIMTIILIIVFIGFQFIEYKNAIFTITDGVFGTVFYAATGLHILHIMILLLILIISYMRIRNYQLTISHHVGYETTIIYVHILDII